jgi:hypothetical protein
VTWHLVAVVAIGLGGILVVLVLALLLIRGLLTAAHLGLRWALRRALGVKAPPRSSRLAGRGGGRHRQPGPAAVRRRTEPAPALRVAEPLRVHLPRGHVPSWALHTEDE